jgi:hypothetical protein
MVPHHFFYQLALLAIIWLFVMLHLTGAKPGLPVPPVPAKPKRKRSTEPKAFEGLTQKPHCALCEQETGETPPAGVDNLTPTDCSSGRKTHWTAAVECLRGRRFRDLLPNLESFLHLLTIGRRRIKMAPRPEMLGDGTIGGEEALGMTG